MDLCELRMLIETDQVKEIILSGSAAESGRSYMINVVGTSPQSTGTLRTGRSLENKNYASLDRAVNAMVALGYKGEFKVRITVGEEQL